MGTGDHLAQLAGVTTTQLQAATEGKGSKFIVSFGNRRVQGVKRGGRGDPQLHLKFFTAQYVHGLGQVRAERLHGRWVRCGRR